jgi:hypothetical protein
LSAAKNKKSNNALLHELRESKVVLVDEISMLNSNGYNLISMISTCFPHLVFILIGDFAQFPPTKDPLLKNKETYENSEILHYLSKGNKVKLTQCRRVDEEGKELFAFCQRIRNKLNIDDWIPLFAVNEFTKRNIAYTHLTRMLIIEFVQSELTENVFYKLIPPDLKFEDGETRTTQFVRLFVGCLLVCYRTNKQLKVKEFDMVHNSELFEVTALFDDYFEVKRVLKRAVHNMCKENGMKSKLDAADNERLQIRYYDIGAKKEQIGFHRIFRPAWCITCHQSQGDTIC